MLFPIPLSLRVLSSLLFKRLPPPRPFLLGTNSIFFFLHLLLYVFYIYIFFILNCLSFFFSLLKRNAWPPPSWNWKGLLFSLFILRISVFFFIFYFLFGWRGGGYVWRIDWTGRHDISLRYRERTKNKNEKKQMGKYRKEGLIISHAQGLLFWNIIQILLIFEQQRCRL